ncbi:MAG: gamma-glutamylcyclotransferase family protein [Opitutus sp.]
MKRRLFVYGTLKRGGCNHRHLAGQAFVAEACTAPGFALFNLGGFPGIAPAPDDMEGVRGELWAVDGDALAQLDEFEGVPGGLYRRGPIPLQAPFEELPIDTYFPVRSVAGLQRIGTVWLE